MSPTDVDDLAGRLRLAVSRLHRTLRRDGTGRLTVPQYLLLHAIERSGPLRMADLAAQQGVPPSNLTRIVAFLTGEGLVVRQTGTDDRRSAIVSISPEGRRVVHRVVREKAEILGAKIAGLSPERQRAIADAAAVLEKLAEDT
jgi:DNA-binding MarR family transcriptional regulator